MRAVPLLCFGLAVGLVVAACGAGSTASSIRPSEITYAQAVGAAECRPVDDLPEPLAVDWRPEVRSDLEVAMHDGLSVVAYDCNTIRLCLGAGAEGSYGFVGTTTKEQVIQLDNSDELKANLPFSGAALSAKLGGDMARGATLDIALVMVGKRVASRRLFTTADLQGDCAGATHFVQSATVGAFSMQTGARARVHSAAELFSVGVEGASASTRSVRNQDGSLEDCRKSTPDAQALQGQCGAILRLQLRRLGMAASESDIAEHNPCPKGFALAAGKCTLTTAGVAHLCAYGDADDCKAQCDAGDAGSCANLGLMYDVGRGLKADTLRAAELFQTACEKGNAPSCGRLGEMFLAGSGPAADEVRAREFLRRGCQGGWFEACTHLGALERKANATINVVALWTRSCTGGDGEGCTSLGFLHTHGLGVPLDLAKAAASYRQGCDLGSVRGCGLLGEAYEKGQGVAPDERHAVELYRRACDAGGWMGCSGLSNMYFRGGASLEKNDARGMEFLSRACTLGAQGACLGVGMRYLNGVGVAKDQARGRDILQHACSAGEKNACALLSGSVP